MGSKPNAPVFGQIAQGIRDRISRGELRPGDSLPTVRELAQELKVNQNTANRAYAELRAEGLIGGRSSQGSRVLAEREPGRIRQIRESALRINVARFIGEQVSHGFGLPEIEAAFFGQRERWGTQDAPSAAPNTPGKTAYFGLGSHDMSLDLMLTYLERAEPGRRIVFGAVGSTAGLAALASGEADFATAHLRDPATGDYNLSFVRAAIPDRPMVLITLALRATGWMVRPGNPKRIHGAADLTRRGVRFVNRQPGAGTRELFDSLLRRERIARKHIRGYDREEKTHFAVAQAIAEGSADVGLGTESAALAHGLDFAQVARERFEIVVPEASPLAGIFGDALGRKPFQAAVTALGGYDVSETGRIRHTY